MINASVLPSKGALAVPTFPSVVGEFLGYFFGVRPSFGSGNSRPSLRPINPKVASHPAFSPAGGDCVSAFGIFFSAVFAHLLAMVMVVVSRKLPDPVGVRLFPLLLAERTSLSVFLGPFSHVGAHPFPAALALPPRLHVGETFISVLGIGRPLLGLNLVSILCHQKGF